MRNIWVLLSSKFYLQKIFREGVTLSNAAQNPVFYCEAMDLGHGYVLENGIITREGERPYAILEVLDDLVDTMKDSQSRYNIMALLINNGFKIEVDGQGYYYSKFYSPSKLPLRTNVTLDEAKKEIKASYKERIPMPSKGPFEDSRSEKVALDDEAFQYIAENEIYYLGDKIMEMFGIGEEEAVAIMEDLYTSLEEVGNVRKNINK